MDVLYVDNNMPEPCDSHERLADKLAVCHEQTANICDAATHLTGHPVLRWFEVFKEHVARTEVELRKAQKSLAELGTLDNDELHARVEHTLGTWGGVRKFESLQLAFEASRRQACSNKK